MNKYIGFDMDSKKTVCCVVEAGQKERYRTIGPDIESMIKFLKAEKKGGYRVEIVFEISGQAGFIYDSLISYVDDIKVANPSKMTWIYRTAKKNDRIDARKMAVLLSIGEIPEVYMPSKEVRQWRERLLHRKKIVCKVVQVKNRIRATFKSQGYSKPANKGGWWKKANRVWMQSVCEASAGISDLWHMHVSNLLDELELLDAQLKRVTQYLDRQPGGKLLMSIPGVGPRTSEAVLAYTDDVRRFGNYKQYCSYFGLTPKLDESGDSRRIGHISKRGPSIVRWVICESSWKVIRKSKSLREFYERVMAGQKQRKKIAIIAVARKLLSIMRAMQLTGELFNEELVNRVVEARQVA
ncbi:IS110 family transposase [Planctomycetota bacterium]